MSTLTDHELALLAAERFRPFHPERINPASINLGIGTSLLREVPRLPGEPARRRGDTLQQIDLSRCSQADPYWVEPGEWILCDAEEWITIPPDMEATVTLRSSAARAGWDHALAGYVDPGYSGRLTLEFVNCRRHSALPLYPGLQLVQLRVFRLGAIPERHYGQTGRYQGAEAVEACRDQSVICAA